MGGKTSGTCKFCKKEFANKYAHEARCQSNPDKQYVKCRHCQKLILEIEIYKHNYCPKCKQCSTGSNFDLHVARHATTGEVYSKKLEQLFNNDQLKIQKALKTGRKFVDEINKHFKERHNREKTTYYVYLILKAHKQGLLSFEEFCECIVYAGRGTDSRIDPHALGNKETNDELRVFFEQCFEEKVQPIAFIPFVSLLSDEASSFEASIISALDPSNLANVYFGSMSKFDWESDDMATAGAWFLHEAYNVYLKTPTNLDRKMKSRALFENPDKWHIKLNRKELVEKEIYTGKELMKKSNPKDVRYIKIPSSVSDNQITRVLALLSAGDRDLVQLLNAKSNEKEPDQKRRRLE